MSKQITGIFPPLTTPFVNGQVAYDKFKETIVQLNKTGLSGYVVFGSNGESVYLSVDEKLKLVQAAREVIPKDKHLIVGTGLESIAETIKLTNECAKLGATHALILTPSYFGTAMTHDAMIKYFRAVADAVKIPVIIYNVPKFTNIEIQPKTVAELAKHSNIVGIKNSSLNISNLIEYVALTPATFSVLVGTASILYPGLCVGAVGGVCALANVSPRELVQVQKLFEEGKQKASLNLQQRLMAINTAVTGTYGVAGLKFCMDQVGYFGGDPRLPLLPLGNEAKVALQKLMVDAKIIASSKV